jgi:hypothetical protein
MALSRVVAVALCVSLAVAAPTPFIPDIIANHPNLTIVNGLMQSNGFSEALRNSGPITVWGMCPADDPFACSSALAPSPLLFMANSILPRVGLCRASAVPRVWLAGHFLPPCSG